MSEDIFYKVDEYITLKMEGGKTLIYIKEEPFMYYTRLELCIYKENIIQKGHGSSIDKSINIQKRFAKHNSNPIVSEFHPRIGIHPIPPRPPEQEFWEHCSDIRKWAKNNYDTRVLNYWVAFPLLEKLSRIGKPRILQIFKNEIAKGIENGNPPVRSFIFDENYMQYLTKAELKDIFKAYLENYHATKDLRILYEFGSHRIDTARKLLDDYLIKLHDLLKTVDFDKLIQFYFKITDLFSIVELWELGDSKAKILVQQLKPLVEDYFMNKKNRPITIKFPEDLFLKENIE